MSEDEDDGRPAADQRRPEQNLSAADVDCLLTATAMLGFLIDDRADLAQELADGTPDEVLVNGQLHISRFLLDGLRERADLEPEDVLDSIRTQALDRQSSVDTAAKRPPEGPSDPR